jgi:hypothetical protein
MPFTSLNVIVDVRAVVLPFSRAVTKNERLPLPEGGLTDSQEASPAGTLTAHDTLDVTVTGSVEAADGKVREVLFIVKEGVGAGGAGVEPTSKIVVKFFQTSAAL